MGKSSNLCWVCQHTGEDLGPVDDFFPQVLIHLRCRLTAMHQDWIMRQCAENPAYRRYRNLMTMGLDLNCPHCRTALRLMPKAIGMAAGMWDAGCNRCARVREGALFAYHQPQIYQELEELRRKFVLGLDFQMNVQRCGQYDALIQANHCPCGGSFSLLAPPRCSNCQSVVLDSGFHVVYQDGAV